MTGRKFPPVGFLVLGVLNIMASLVFIVRVVVVEATTERIFSAVAFGVMGVLLLAAYWKKPKLSASKEKHLVQLHADGSHTVAELCELFDVTRSTVYRAIDRQRVASLAGSID